MSSPTKENENMAERVQKLIAKSGLCSRRKAEELITAGRVTVDGEVANLGDKAEETQEICIDGKQISFTEKLTYILLNKPRGYVCTLSDEHVEHLVTELVDCGVRIYPVGRLDKESEGLLLLTNDGDFAQAVMHPKGQVDKVYQVTVSGWLDGCSRRLAAVQDLDGESIVPAQVRELGRKGDSAKLEVTIHQGKNRQIRRMCEAVGLSVLQLKRVQEHSLKLGDLPVGQWRYLTGEEIEALKGSGTK